jgi:hypothetical protein
MDNRMFKSEDWTKWITALVGVSTALFTVITFAYKELIVPNAEPINISIDIKVEPQDSITPSARDANNSMTKNGEFTPVIFSAKATNASNKTIALQSPFWVVFGIHRPQGSKASPYTSNVFIAPRETIKHFNSYLGNPLISDIPRLEVPQGSYQPKGSKQPSDSPLNLVSGETQRQTNQELIDNFPRKLVAVGELFTPREIKSKETIGVQRTIFVDKEDKYDFLEARVYIPTLAKSPNRQPNRIKFYSFASASSEGPDFQMYTLINSWCLEPMWNQLNGKRDMIDVLMLFEPIIFHESRSSTISAKAQQQSQAKADAKSNNGSLRSTSFCRLDPRLELPSLFLESNLSPDQEIQANTQIFTSTYEVLLEPTKPASSEPQ